MWVVDSATKAGVQVALQYIQRKLITKHACRSARKSEIAKTLIKFSKQWHGIDLLVFRPRAEAARKTGCFRILRFEATMGESSALRHLVDLFLTPDVYYKLPTTSFRLTYTSYDGLPPARNWLRLAALYVVAPDKHAPKLIDAVTKDIEQSVAPEPIWEVSSIPDGKQFTSAGRKVNTQSVHFGAKKQGAFRRAQQGIQ